jgi:hypothetical protein
MITLEIAQKYGVPTPETCKELGFEPCNMYWHISENNQHWALCLKGGTVIQNTNGYYFSDDLIVYNAPQMHEIAQLLPCEDKYTGAYIVLNGNYLACSHAKYEKCVTIYKYMNVMVENHHYAEAYAQLYIKLKKENIL